MTNPPRVRSRVAAPSKLPPDTLKHGALTEEQIDRAMSWLAEKWTESDCPWHGTTTWQLGDVFGQVDSWAPIGANPGSRRVTYPVVVLTCVQCGYTVLVNALRIGLVVPPPEPEMSE
jgi:hypothetical protein